MGGGVNTVQGRRVVTGWCTPPSSLFHSGRGQGACTCISLSRLLRCTVIGERREEGRRGTQHARRTMYCTHHALHSTDTAYIHIQHTQEKGTRAHIEDTHTSHPPNYTMPVSRIGSECAGISFPPLSAHPPPTHPLTSGPPSHTAWLIDRTPIIILPNVPLLLPQAYHSAYNESTEYNVMGNMAILPLRTRIRGPAPSLGESRARARARGTRALNWVAPRGAGDPVWCGGCNGLCEWT